MQIVPVLQYEPVELIEEKQFLLPDGVWDLVKEYMGVYKFAINFNAQMNRPFLRQISPYFYGNLFVFSDAKKLLYKAIRNRIFYKKPRSLKGQRLAMNVKDAFEMMHEKFPIKDAKKRTRRPLDKINH